jgi:subtilisin family serine protease
MNIKVKIQAFFLLVFILVSASFVNSEEVIITYKNNSSEDYSISSVIDLEDNLNVIKKFEILDGFVAEITEEEKEVLKENNEIIISDIKQYSAILDVSAPHINTTSVWKIQLNSTNITGAKQSICVLDTGVDYNHTAFGNCWGDNNESSSCVVIGGYDFINEDDDPIDDNGHGTHVAGIIASQDATYRGIAPDTKIIAIKILDSAGNGNGADIISAMEWCINNASRFNITAISMSLGDSGFYEEYCSDVDFDPVVQSAIDANISVIAAAGNCEDEVSASTCDGLLGVSHPACLANVIPVGAVGDADTQYYQRWNSPSFQVLAPGYEVASTKILGGFISASGTSMAAPFVSATITLLQQYSKLKNDAFLNSTQITRALNTTDFRINDIATGVVYPRIDVYAALGTLTNPKFISINHNNLSTISRSTPTLPLEILFNEEVDFIYSINGSANKTGCTSCSIFNQTIALPGFENLTFNFYVNDEVGNSNQSDRIIYINQSDPTYSDASYIGESTVTLLAEDKTGQEVNLSDLSVYINGSNNFSISYPEGNYTINLTDSTNQTIIEFNYTLNQTNETLDLSAMILMRGNETTSNYSYLIVRGLNLTSQSRTKTLYLEKNVVSDNICIKDTDVFSSNEFSTDCSGSSEYLINCPGSLGVYSCEFTSNESHYKISGLSHSAVSEVGNFCGDGIVNNGETCSSCSADAGTCPSTPSSSSGGGGGGGGGASTTKQNIISTTAYEMKQGHNITIEKNDAIIFKTLNGEDHNITIHSISSLFINLTIHSDPINMILTQNEEREINLSDQLFYDFYIKINLLSEERANIKIQNIFKSIKAEEEISSTEKSIEPIYKNYNAYLYFITAIIIAITILFLNRKLNKLEKLNKLDEESRVKENKQKLKSKTQVSKFQKNEKKIKPKAKRKR